MSLETFERAKLVFGSGDLCAQPFSFGLRVPQLGLHLFDCRGQLLMLGVVVSVSGHRLALWGDASS